MQCVMRTLWKIQCYISPQLLELFDVNVDKSQWTPVVCQPPCNRKHALYRERRWVHGNVSPSQWRACSFSVEYAVAYHVLLLLLLVFQTQITSYGVGIGARLIAQSRSTRPGDISIDVLDIQRRVKCQTTNMNHLKIPTRTPLSCHHYQLWLIYH